ncbi:hypothetical protein PT2222_50314 [Paraburkholderia tropica]
MEPEGGGEVMVTTQALARKMGASSAHFSYGLPFLNLHCACSWLLLGSPSAAPWPRSLTGRS